MKRDLEAVEYFHLQVARLLLAGPDKGAFAIKGGCNLRFFFESPRFSEDIDFDVSESVPVHVLKDRMTKVLGGPALTLALRNRGLQVVNVTAPKQTETTQRWKMAIARDGAALPRPTKVEFSRRDKDDASVTEVVSPSVLAQHQSMPVLAPHYSVGPALRQKVRALADRREVQARDVFDLGAVLIPKIGGQAGHLQAPVASLKAAMDRTLALTYADYKGQVVSFLHPDHEEELGSEAAWDAIQLQVVEYFDRALTRQRGPSR